MEPKQEQPIDLTNCDREPIHVPGAVQPHGVLLAIAEPELVVRQVSDNAELLLGEASSSVLGRPLDRLFDHASMRALRGALGAEVIEHENPIPLRAGGKLFDGICHRHRGATILELEPVGGEALSLQQSLRPVLATLQALGTMAELCDAAAQGVKALTGFERVMVYRFDEFDHGAVISEAKEPPLEPYLGLHYPASDIPRQARDLYLRNWLRIIPNARYVPSQIVPSLRPESDEPLDLSHSVLRSVSPIHLEYMRNMGTAASMSISLIVRGRLWGLVSCAHHSGPRYLRYEERAACEVLGRLMSLQLAALEELESRSFRATREGPLRDLESAMRRGDSGVLDQLLAQAPLLLTLVGASGAAVVEGRRCSAVGSHPGEAAILELAQRLEQLANGADVLATSCASELLSDAVSWKDQASGVLTFTLPGEPQRRLIWFRPELVQTVDWAGDPHKPVDTDAGTTIHPRRSFALWQEQVRLRSLPWLAGEVEAARALRRRAVEIDLARQVERAQSAVRARDDLVAVVSHDLRNPLGVVQMQSSLLLRGLGAGEEESSRRLRASAERIQRATDRMNALINDLLDLAKIEAGRFEVHTTPQDTAQILEEALVVMSPLAEQKAIKLELDATPTPAVFADRDRVYQVLSNLISNAIKFTPEGGSVQLCTRYSAGEVQFSVIDTGPGIPVEQLPHVFNRYWQARKTSRQGTGLGLYIAKGIVEAHEGRLWAESKPGVGSRFHFTLPTSQQAST